MVSRDVAAAEDTPSLPIVESSLALTLFEQAGRPSAPFGVYAVPASDETSGLARNIEQGVFAEFFNNSPALLAEQYGPYEASTWFFIVLDHQRMAPAGMTRIILESPIGLKTLHDVEKLWNRPFPETLVAAGLNDVSPLIDVATIAVAPQYRRKATQGIVSMAMYQTLCRASYACSVGAVVTVLDLVVLDMIQEIGDNAYTAFPGCEPLSYLDSPASLPVYCLVGPYAERLRFSNPSTYELLLQGHGMEASVSLPDLSAFMAAVTSTSR